MKCTIVIVSVLVWSVAAMAQVPPLSHPKSFFREDGQPTDKVLLKASQDCHAHNPPEDAKTNCTVIDDQITQRATETGVKQPVMDRAKELTQ